jgi:hypothetical protein
MLSALASPDAMHGLVKFTVPIDAVHSHGTYVLHIFHATPTLMLRNYIPFIWIQIL